MEFLGKKGIFFSFVSIVLAVFFLVFFSADTRLPLDHSTDSTQFRINFIDDYREGMIDYMEAALFSVTYNTLSEMSGYVYLTGSPIGPETVFESWFAECILNGTMDSGSVNCSGDGEENNITFTYWVDSFVNISSRNMSLDTKYSVRDVNIYQVKPFYVNVNLTVSYDISDIILSLKRNITIRTEVPIEGIRDPLGRFYIGAWDRVYEETDIKETDWNVGNLTNFTIERKYRHRAKGPSFIMRFGNIISGSACCGLEAVLSDQPGPGGDPIIDLENRSYVDHLYFRDWSSPSFTCDQIYEVDGIGGGGPSRTVKLDEENLAAYNISTDDWIPTC